MSDVLDNAKDGLIAGVKIDARNAMRHDPRVWYEALEAALDKLLPAFWDAARSAKETPQVVIEISQPRCMACGRLDHNCPTGGRILR